MYKLKLQREPTFKDREQSKYKVFQPYKLRLEWLDTLNEIFKSNKNADGHSECVSSLVYSSASINTNANNNNNKNSEEKMLIESKLSRVSSFTNEYLKLKSLILDKKLKKVNSFYDYQKHEDYLIKRLAMSKNESEALATLEKMWRDGKFCDLILVVNGREYLAHRAVLAYYSSKFK
jgi:hypothetical protein